MNRATARAATTKTELSRDQAEAILRRLRVVEAREEATAFVDSFCWGQDFEAKPVPRPFRAKLWPWQRAFVAELQHHEGHLWLVMLKSRGPGATWCCIWFATWLVWARPPSQVLLLSDTAPKAKALMRRHTFAVERLPPELEYPVPDLRRKGIDNLTSRVFPNGSEIHSLTGDPDSIRSYHPSLVVLDEAAKLRSDPRPPLIGLSSDIVMMSTADGLGNPFEEVWTDAYKRAGAEWGYKPLFVGWRAIPHLKERPRGSPQVVDQEYPDTPEAALAAGSANLFRLEDDQLVDPFAIPKAWPVVVGCDPGVRTGGWVWVARVCGEQGEMADGDLLVCDEYDSAEATIADQVAEDARRRKRLRVVQSVIDPSAYTRTHSGDAYLRVADLFGERGINFSPGSNDLRAAIALIQEHLQARRLWVFRNLPGTIGDLRTATLQNTADKHFCAALRYAVLEKPEDNKPLRKAKTVDLAAEQMREVMREIDRPRRRGPPRIRGTDRP